MDVLHTQLPGFDPDVAAEDMARVREVLPELELVENPRLRDLVARIWVHSWRASQWPDPTDAFMTIGGLPGRREPYVERWNQIAHTRAVVAMVQNMLPTVEQHVGCVLDADLAFTAALLHDVGKLTEYAPGGAEGPLRTPVGAVLHHATIGAQWAAEAGFPTEVVHAIVAHSPATSAEPSTPEALLIKLADQAITDFNRMTTELEAES